MWINFLKKGWLKINILKNILKNHKLTKHFSINYDKQIKISSVNGLIVNTKLKYIMILKLWTAVFYILKSVY